MGILIYGKVLAIGPAQTHSNALHFRSAETDKISAKNAVKNIFRMANKDLPGL